VLAEAMSAGVVPIAYATDGPSFILKDFPEHLVPIGDVEGLAERLRAFAEQNVPPSLRKSLANEINTRFSPDIIAEEWRKLFEEA
jgi:glycosyltransferase involved in cell wall biosynthesis